MEWFLDDRGNNRDVNDSETQCDIDVENCNEAGIAPDYSEAAKLCKLAAEQGHAPAQYNLGFMYEMGQGVEQDASEALKWYRSAADNGYAPAQLELGEMYESGTVGARDCGDAVTWYRLAADQGNTDAQLRLGNLYSKGQGVAQNHNEAANWYRLAGEQEHSEAQYNLGRMYASGAIGAIDYDQAIKWYRLAADQGHPEAINELKKIEPKSIPEDVVKQQSHPRTLEQKSPLFIREPSTQPEPPPLVREPEQRETNTSSTDYKRIGIPPPDSIRFPLLYVINSMGGEIELFDAIGRIAAYFDMPPDELQHTPLSTVQSRLIQAMQNAAQILFSEKCIERSRVGFWKITATGIQELRRFKEIANQEAKSRQAAFLVPPRTKSTTQEPSTQLKSPELLKETQIDTKKTQQNNSDLKIKIPPGERIKIPLLRIIQKMGGRADIPKVLPHIGKYFKIPVRHSIDGTLAPLAADLFEKTKYAAKLLWYDDYLELIKFNTWRITPSGTALLKRSETNHGRGDFEETIQSIKTSQAISKSPNTSPEEKFAVPSFEEPLSKLKPDKMASEDVLKNKQTESSHSGLSAIPLPHRIRIPLLFTMYKLGGEIELHQATERIAEHFNIPSMELGQSPFSTVEKRLFEAMQESARLLRNANFIERSRLGYWKITDAGMNWLKSSGKLD